MADNVDHREIPIKQHIENRDTFPLHEQNGQNVRRFESMTAIVLPTAGFLTAMAVRSAIPPARRPSGR